ncbi:MAG: hypothetical protein AB6733_19270 [Clostridiaceae bacterium]
MLFRTKKKLSITGFAKEFLKGCYKEKKDIVRAYNDKHKKLQGFLQKQLQVNHKSPYVMREFGVKSGENSKLVVAYYLTVAMKESQSGNSDLAFKYVEYAKKLEINYFQCNKIAAYLYGTTSQHKAKEEFEIALKCCEINEDKVTVYIVYAGYLLTCNDYFGALDKLESAEKILKGNINVYLIFEKSKILGCLNRFEEAYKVLEKIDTSNISNNFYNIYVTRKAGLKRRESELYDYRDLGKILDLIKEAYELLKSSKEPDRGIYQYMAILVKSLAYLYYSPEANKFMLEILDEYYSYMRKESDFKKVQDIILSKVEDIEDKNLVKKVSKYTINIGDRLKSLEENEGLVYYLNKDNNFGFFRNKENYQGVYFKITQKLRMLQIGDVIKFERLNQTTKGTMANDILSFYSK